jgi:hypothetical protein
MILQLELEDDVRLERAALALDRDPVYIPAAQSPCNLRLLIATPSVKVSVSELCLKAHHDQP